MREVEELEQQAEAFDIHNEAMGKQNDDLAQRTSELVVQVQKMEIHNNELVLQAQELTERIEKAEEKEKAVKEILSKHDLRAETFKTISKEVNAETKKDEKCGCSNNQSFWRRGICQSKEKRLEYNAGCFW